MEPQFHCSLEGKTITMEYLNVMEVEIKYYVIDPEVLFSRTPFLMQKNEDFSYTKPMVAFHHPLDKDLKNKDIAIVPEFEKQNLVIEVSAVGKQHYLTYYSTSLKVAVIENYGELKVTDQEDNPLA